MTYARRPMTSKPFRIPIRPRAPGTLPPWMVFFLNLPASLTTGYCLAVIPYTLTQAGLGIGGVAELVAIFMLPLTLSVIWTPVLDGTLGPKRWYGIAFGSIFLCLAALAAAPMDIAHLAVVKVLMLLMSISCNLNVITCNMIMAYDVNPARKGSAAGWREASNLGGSGIGGGVALMLAQREGVIVPAVMILVMSTVFAALIGFVAPRPTEDIAQRPVERFMVIGRDIWALLRSRGGRLTILLMLAPVGTGAAGNLFITFGKPFHVNANTMALVNGTFGGLASIAGALIAGWVCDRMDRRAAFCVFGLFLAVVAAAMAAAPRTPADFIIFNLVYSLSTGCCYAAFAAAILDVAGEAAAATRMGLLTCLSNVPIMLMGLLEGRFGEVHGVTGVMLVDAAAGAVPAALFLAVIGVLRWHDARRDLVPAAA